MGKLFGFIKSIKNPYLLFLPFLFFFIGLVLHSPTQGNSGDESRYLMFAQNLLHGFYSPPAPDTSLWNGPGYPIFLMPFVGFHLPLICITLMNAVLYYLSIVLLFKTLRQFVSANYTLVFCFTWACYFIAYSELTVIYSEILTSFLMTLLLFHLMKSFDIKNVSKKNAIISGFIIGYIVLTKIIFSYVILLMGIGLGFLWLLNRKSFYYKRSILILLISFITVSPYLAYTFHLTGKIYYFGDSGGMSLYWMSTPFENETGDWYHERELYIDYSKKAAIDPETKDLKEKSKYLLENHGKDYEEINKFSGIARDEVYKKIAINNIKAHPLKFFKNCVSNAERFFFHFPYSYSVQRNNLKIPLTSIVVVCMLFSLLFSLLNWRSMLFPVRFILLFIFLYIGGSILVSAYIRMFTIIIPIVFFWIAYVFQRSIQLKFNFKNNKELSNN